MTVVKLLYYIHIQHILVMPNFLAVLLLFFQLNSVVPCRIAHLLFKESRNKGG